MVPQEAYISEHLNDSVQLIVQSSSLFLDTNAVR